MRLFLPALLVTSLTFCGIARADDDDDDRPREGEKKLVKKEAADKEDDARPEKKAEKPSKPDGFAKEVEKKVDKKGGGGDRPEQFVKTGDPAERKGDEEAMRGQKMERAMAELRERRERDLGQLREAEQKVREAYEIRERVLRGQAEAFGDAGEAKFRKAAAQGEKMAPKRDGEARSGRDIERASLEQDAKRLQQQMMAEQARHEAAMRELQAMQKSLENRARALQAE